MSDEEDLMKQVEELKKMIREAEEEKEEMRRGREGARERGKSRGKGEARERGKSRGREEARRRQYVMRGLGAGGLASRAMGSAVHVEQQGTENNDGQHNYPQPFRRVHGEEAQSSLDYA